MHKSVKQPHLHVVTRPDEYPFYLSLLYRLAHGSITLLSLPLGTALVAGFAIKEVDSVIMLEPGANGATADGKFEIKRGSDG